MWRRTLGLAVIAAAAPSAAHAEGGLRGFLPEGSYYVRAELGASLESDIENELRGSLNSETDVRVPEGIVGAVGLGWAAPNSGLRVEALLEYGEAEEDGLVFDVASASNVPFTRTYRLGGGWIMAHYDFLYTERVQPSIGFGLGAVWADTEVESRPSVNAASLANLADSDVTLGLRASLGLAYVLTDRWVAEVGYRYIFAPDLESTFRLPTTGQLVTSEDDIQSHAVTVGMRYALGSIDH
ncbi:MAG: outer membrane protein [Caulobacterales bacterium]|jgi:opacity protein-like surface antigen